MKVGTSYPVTLFDSSKKSPFGVEKKASPQYKPDKQKKVINNQDTFVEKNKNIAGLVCNELEDILKHLDEKMKDDMVKKICELLKADCE